MAGFFIAPKPNKKTTPFSVDFNFTVWCNSIANRQTPNGVFHPRSLTTHLPMLLTPPTWECSSGSIAPTSMVVALRGISAVSSPSKHGLRRKRVRRRRPKTETVMLVGIPAPGPTRGHQERARPVQKCINPCWRALRKAGRAPDAQG